MIKLTAHFVLLSIHEKAQESAYKRGFAEIVETAAAVSLVDDDVFIGIGERQDDPMLHVTIRRTKQTMAWSDWGFAHEPESGEREYVYRKSFVLEPPREVMIDVCRILMAPLVAPKEDVDRRHRIHLHLEVQRAEVARLSAIAQHASTKDFLARAGRDLDAAIIWLDVSEDRTPENEARWLVAVESIVESAKSHLHVARVTLGEQGPNASI